MTGCKCNPVDLFLDRQLRLKSVPVDMKTAESLQLGGGKYIMERVFVTITGVVDVPGLNGASAVGLTGEVSKIELLTYEGTPITTIAASAIPLPGTGQTSERSIPKGVSHPSMVPNETHQLSSCAGIIGTGEAVYFYMSILRSHFGARTHALCR